MADRAREPFDPRAFVRTLSTRPGVYRMLGADGEVLYVGKARNLRRRVGSYFSRPALSPRLHALLSQVRAIEVTITRSEAEALLLENRLIKAHRPRFNVLLRDDKSYPYIYVSTEDEYPRIAFHRGPRRRPGRYFGPYPSAGAVRETLSLLQKVFRLRTCEDSVFRNRSRPCLQHQIGRCSAPCVGLIGRERYARDVADTLLFLEGRGEALIEDMVRRMEAAAEALEFEQAARYRDQIAALRKVAARQYVEGERGDVDIVAAVAEGGQACVQLFTVRGGRNLGNRAWFPRVPPGADAAEVLEAFLGQHYPGREIPRTLVVHPAPADAAVLADALSAAAGHRVEVLSRVRGARRRWLETAIENARAALAARLASRTGLAARLEALRESLGLPGPPERIECLDVSHTMGERTVAACVVFDAEGPVKGDWRRYNIEGVAPGDDYGALRQALERRYARLQREHGPLPDVLLIDGGRGQVAEAARVLAAHGVEGVTLVGVAKGPERRPGMERLYLPGRREPLRLSPDAPALHLIQQIRDEAHRFAITGHRQRRGRARRTSVLEGIPGMGPRRRQTLLKHFGGLQEVMRAGVEDLAQVPGISRVLAQRIYDALHGEAA